MKPIAELPFVGGHVALDFVNTAEGRGGPRMGDALCTPADLAEWGRRSGLVTDAVGAGAGSGGAGDAESELTRAIAARELLYSLFLDLLQDEANSRPSSAQTRLSPEEALARLSGLAAEAYGVGELRPGEDGGLRWAWPPDDLATVRHVAVTSAVDLLRDVPAGRLRQCPGDNCGWFFLDTTKRGNRRWCSMGECGQDAKDERRRALRQASARKAGLD